MACILCWFFIFLSVLILVMPSPGITPDLPKEYTRTEPNFSDAASICVVLALARVIILAGVIMLTTRSQHWSFNRVLFLLRHVVVFMGGCSLGANTCLFIACLLGALPAVYDLTTFVSLVVCHLVVSLLLLVVAWTQEKIMFEDMENRETETKEGDDTLEYSLIY
jgi:hypothetical protein